MGMIQCGKLKAWCDHEPACQPCVEKLQHQVAHEMQREHKKLWHNASDIVIREYGFGRVLCFLSFHKWEQVENGQWASGEYIEVFQCQRCALLRAGNPYRFRNLGEYRI